MRNYFFSKMLILLIVVQTGMISSVPLVLCFDDDHIQIEIADKTLYKINKQKAVSIIDIKENEPGNCFDIPILSEFYAKNNNKKNKKFLLEQNVFILKCFPLLNIKKINDLEINRIIQPELINNTLLLKMSFLI